MSHLFLIGHRKGGAGVILLRKQRSAHSGASSHSGHSGDCASVRVAVKCPTCGKLAESQTRGIILLTEPLQSSALELHADCDLTELFGLLSATALEFARACSPDGFL